MFKYVKYHANSIENFCSFIYRLTTCRGDPGKTLFLAFAGDACGDYNFVTGGVSHIRFWQVSGRFFILFISLISLF